MPRSFHSRFITVLAGVGLALAGAAAPAAADDGYTVQTLHFAIKTGPSNNKACDVIGDLYLPIGASSTSRVPAILTTNGFGGSKDDQKGTGIAFAMRGYAVLSYSGLGFGGSDCKVTLDDPDWDGRAASQLVSYLGGKAGIAFTDDAHKTAAPVLDAIVQDNHDHLGHTSTFDPRVGMVGGSYGGEVQFAAAGLDPRIDTIVPIITWNDLSYSLGPNNTAQTAGVTSSTPGATKLTWGLFFSALGMADGLQTAQSDPSRLLPCPNFADFVCPALVLAGTTGFFDAVSQKALRHASVSTYMSKIKIPTLLMQGQSDTLFNLNEAVATYKALRAQGTPVKMIWQSWGHSSSAPAPGELDLASTDTSAFYQNGRVANWFDHYLKDDHTDLGPNFAYFRDWVAYTGNAAPAYGSATSFPVGTARKFYLSGTNALSTSPNGLKTAQQTLVAGAAGAPTSISELDAIGSMFKLPLPELDLPGTAATWTSNALSSKLDVVGSPTVTLKVMAPVAAAAQGAGPAAQLVLFLRIQDVGPDGKASDIRLLTAPVRVPNAKVAFTTTMPAFVHRFAPGHKVRLVVAGGSLNYRGGLTPQVVGISVGSSSQVLSLPVVN
jgi:ABC-2 type transport system ATP-binding protein